MGALIERQDPRRKERQAFTSRLGLSKNRTPRRQGANVTGRAVTESRIAGRRRPASQSAHSSAARTPRRKDANTVSVVSPRAWNLQVAMAAARPLREAKKLLVSLVLGVLASWRSICLLRRRSSRTEAHVFVRLTLASWRLGVRSSAFAICACGHPAAPQEPTATVRADVRSAETAELHREHEVARARYETAIADAHDPASQAFARQEYAETLLSWGEIPAAKAQLEAAIAAKPDHPGSWQDLGMIRNHDGDYAGAQAAFERAKALAPDDPRPRINLAALRWKHGDRAAAAAEYRSLLELDLPDRLREKVRWAIDELAKPVTRTAPAAGAPAPSS
ncbi:MAG: repeat-containing protein [Myxococcales bacterium]|nr:repeat-containing protein [Myxococcales bacterium]